MTAPPERPSECRRLQALRSYAVLDTLPEEDFDDLTTLAAHICAAPVALISLIDEDRQWFKSRVGTELEETALDLPFCVYALRQPGLFIVPDASRDARFADHPLVTGEPGISFYAGAPLLTPEGEALGTLCVIDYVPRTLTAAQKQALRVLSRQVMTHLELRRQRQELKANEGKLRAIFEAEAQEKDQRRRQAERARRASEQQFASAFVHAPIGVALVAPDGLMLQVNHSMEQMLGYSGGALLGHYFQDITHPDDLAADLENVRRLLEGETISYQMEKRYLHQRGDFIWAHLSVSLVRDEQREPVHFIAQVQDITQRKQSEQCIAEQAALIDYAPDAIIVRDLEQRITFWSKGAERLFGWTSAEATGRKVGELLHPDPEILGAALETLLRQGSWNGEIEKVGKGGRSFTVMSRWTLLRDAQERPVSILAICTDITERKKLELQFLRAQRMESIGTLAGGIAHDLNNSLGPIIMSLNLLAAKFTDPDSVELLDILSTSARRGSDMVRQVLSFARGVEGERQEVQIRHLIPEIERIVNDTFLKNIEVSTRVPDDLWTVMGDATQLHQALLNLCVNARDAMADGGTLTVSAENIVLDAHYAGLSLNHEAQPGPHVLLQVIDTGAGMAPSVVERIFDPFFTTKELNKGTGLGLSTTLAIVKSHGGFIRVHSELGKGTRFEVYLPAQTEHTARAEDEPTPELPRGHGELILVVDDELGVRQITDHTLQAFGYRVVLAANGVEAVAIFAREGQGIAAVLTDMMMPVMDGPTMIQILRQMSPKVPIIAASGHFDEDRIANQGVQRLLAKPYGADLMLKALREVLSDGDASLRDRQVD